MVNEKRGERLPELSLSALLYDTGEPMSIFDLLQQTPLERPRIARRGFD